MAKIEKAASAEALQSEIDGSLCCALIYNVEVLV